MPSDCSIVAIASSTPSTPTQLDVNALFPILDQSHVSENSDIPLTSVLAQSGGENLYGVLALRYTSCAYTTHAAAFETKGLQ
jgi:hypothetical protein